MSLSRVTLGYGYIIAKAELQYRLSLDNFKAEDAQFLSVIHSGANVSESAIIGEGSFISPDAKFGPNVRIGKHSLIDAGCLRTIKLAIRTMTDLFFKVEPFERTRKKILYYSGMELYL